MDGIEGSVERSDSCWSAIVHVHLVWKIGTCIINDAGRQAAHKKQGKYTVFGRAPSVLYSCLKVYISTQKKNFQKNFQTYRLSLQPLILYFN